MTFHNSAQNSMTFQAWKAKKQISMTIQVFQDPYESWNNNHLDRNKHSSSKWVFTEHVLISKRVDKKLL